MDASHSICWGTANYAGGSLRTRLGRVLGEQATARCSAVASRPGQGLAPELTLGNDEKDHPLLRRLVRRK